MYDMNTNDDMIKRAAKIINCLTALDTLCKDDITDCIDYLSDLIGYFNHLDIGENLLPKEDRVEVPEDNDISDYMDFIDMLNQNVIQKSSIPVEEGKSPCLDATLKKISIPNVSTYFSDSPTGTVTSN